MTIERTPNGAHTGIYLDHAATTPLDEDALQAMMPYFSGVYGNADSPHRFGREAAAALDRAREIFATAFHARDGEIFFTASGTESDNLAVFGAARAMAKKGRKKLIVFSAEHYAVLEPTRLLAKNEGVEAVYIPADKRGRADLEFLKREADCTTALVALMTANNELGTIQPVAKAAKIAHEAGALFFTDAVQAAPYMPLNPQEIGADLLSVSAHKFYGPKGVGVLYVKSGTPIERVIAGGEQERGLRGGTVNVAGIVGAAAAYEKALRDMQKNNAAVAAVKEAFLKEIALFPLAEVNGGNGAEFIPSVLNLRVKGVEHGGLLRLMDLHAIAASAGAACSGGDVRLSHVLLAAGYTEEEARESFRLSFGKDNTAEEAIFAARTIAALAKGLAEKTT